MSQSSPAVIPAIVPFMRPVTAIVTVALLVLIVGAFLLQLYLAN